MMEERFKRGFFSFLAYMVFFQGVQAILFIDGIHLLGKYGGILLGTIGKDGNEGLFHVAFTIVSNESDEKWMWFLAMLGEVLYVEDDYDKLTTFTLDR